MSERRNINHRFHRWLTAAELRESDWRKRNQDNFDYYDGEQWSEDEKAELESRNQQPCVLNVVRPTVDMVLALEVEKRIDMQVVGREESDELLGRLLTELLKQVFDGSDVDYYLSRVFREGIIGGRGWAFVHPERDETGQTQIAVEWLPWEEVYIDPFHRKPDGSDARFIIRKVWMDRDHVKKLYPAHADHIDTAFNDDYEGIEYEAQNATSDRGISYYDHRSQRVCLCHCWYRDANKKLRYAVFADELILRGGENDGPESENPYGIDCYPLIPFYAFRTHKGEPKGLVEYLKDAQDQINKLNSKYLWNMSSNRMLVEEGATDDPDELQDEWNRPNGFAVLNSGGLSKVRTEDNLRESAHLSSHLQFLLGMIQRTSGINDSMLGVGGVNERSATQQENRILQGASMQTQILENLHFTKKQVAKVILRLIGRYYSDRRVVRVTQPNGSFEHYALNEPTGDHDESGKPFLNNEISDVLKYDVILKKVPPFSTVRERTMQVFAEVAKSGAFPPELVGKVLLMLSDIPRKDDLIMQLEGHYQQQQQALAAAQSGGGPQ